ncbi:MAG: dTDP-4-dehydrorhamnose 3,5-epimerase [Bacteroidota bacterium]
MKVIPTALEGLVELQPRVFEDPRGYFFESYNAAVFTENGIDVAFHQDNQSLSQKGVLRGLHFQNPPHAQGKLVRVIKGAVLDVSVDIRKGSSTYGQHAAITLTESQKNMIWIPPGFAHGFLTLEDETIFAYKCSGFYNKEAEGGLRWDDPDLHIDWGVTDPLVSEKDRQHPFFRDFSSLF